LNARARYRVTHWGKAGPHEFRDLGCADPGARPLVELGELVSVVYLTEKGGDSGPTEYEHAFAARRRPVLAFHEGGLVICGGGYRVGVRGIHG
jgi:hypothetical protein